MGYSTNNPWYYAVNGERKGPVSFEELQSKIPGGEVSAATLVWSQGLSDWLPASQVGELFVAPVAQVAQVADEFIPAVSPGLSATGSVATPSAGFAQATGTSPKRTLRPVKPANFWLWLGLGIGSLLFYVVGVVLMAVSEEVTAAAGFFLFIGAALIIASTVIGCIYIYRAWFAIQDDAIPARTTPGKAVGFMFIPLFSLYWMFVALHGWSQDYNRLISVYEYSDAPKVPEGLFLAFPILALVSIVPVVGMLASLALLVVAPLVFYHFVQVINYFSRRAAQQNND